MVLTAVALNESATVELGASMGVTVLVSTIGELVAPTGLSRVPFEEVPVSIGALFWLCPGMKSVTVD